MSALPRGADIVVVTVEVMTRWRGPSRSLRNRSSGSCGERPNVPGPRDPTYRGHLLRENPWLLLQRRQRGCCEPRLARKSAIR
jgi:hypothetical protein